MWFASMAGVKANTFAIEGFSVGQCNSAITNQDASSGMFSSVTNYQAGVNISCFNFVQLCVFA